MLRCALTARHLSPTLVLALRDMRAANGRKVVTGEGEGNRSWIGLVLGMAVLDTLSGSQGRPGPRFKRLLKAHFVSGEDAEIIWTLRNSLLHGYGLPLPSRTFGRGVLLTHDHEAYALDTSQPGRALLSVPVFCSRLVERIAAEAYGSWDVSLINTDYRYF